MNDDIRSRFKVSGSRRDFLGGGSQSPQPRSEQPAPKPVASPANTGRSKPKARPQPQATPAGPIPQRTASKPSRKRPGRVKKVFKSFTVVLILALVGVGAWFATKPSASNLSQNNQDAVDQPQTAGATDDNQAALQEGTIRLVATGTFAAYDSINMMAKNGNSYDYLPLMKDVKPVFDKADISFCHQESLAGGADKGVSGYPDFNAPFQWSEGMIDLGCNVFNLASFNTNDKGKTAIAAAVKYFDDKKEVLAVSGANRNQKEQDKIRYFDIKGVKFASLSFTTSSHKNPANAYGVNVYDKAKAKKKIAEARKNAHFVIVGMAWGKEDVAAVQPQQKSIAKDLASAGADLVIGNGPHILQTAEVIKSQDDRETLVFYSLGNAVNSQLPVENLIGGIAVLDIDIQTRHMINPGILPVYQHYEWTEAQKANSDFNARKNFRLLMLDQAASALSKSQNKTTVEAQAKRVKSIMTKNLDIKILGSKDLE